jgi:uncharacterized protein YpuA (DUF1002 family)
LQRFAKKVAQKELVQVQRKRQRVGKKNENKRCASFAVRKSPVAVTGLCAVKLSISYLLWQN